MSQKGYGSSVDGAGCPGPPGGRTNGALRRIEFNQESHPAFDGQHREQNHKALKPIRCTKTQCYFVGGHCY